MPVPESERRRNHIDMMHCGHCLLPIAIDCLHYQENERPSSEELCQRLADLKETREYRESVEQVERTQNDTAELKKQMGEMQVKEAAAVQQLCELRDENQQQQQRYESEIRSKDAQLKQKDEQVQSQERKIQQLNQQLEEQEQVTAEIQQILLEQVEQLQQQLSQQNHQSTKPTQPPSPVTPLEARVRERQLQQDHSVKEKQSQPSQQEFQHQKQYQPVRQMKLGEWTDGGKAPYNILEELPLWMGMWLTLCTGMVNRVHMTHRHRSGVSFLSVLIGIAV